VRQKLDALDKTARRCPFVRMILGNRTSVNERPIATPEALDFQDRNRRGLNHSRRLELWTKGHFNQDPNIGILLGVLFEDDAGSCVQERRSSTDRFSTSATKSKTLRSPRWRRLCPHKSRDPRSRWFRSSTIGTTRSILTRSRASLGSMKSTKLRIRCESWHRTFGPDFWPGVYDAQSVKANKHINYHKGASTHAPRYPNTNFLYSDQLYDSFVKRITTGSAPAPKSTRSIVKLLQDMSERYGGQRLSILDVACGGSNNFRGIKNSSSDAKLSSGNFRIHGL